MDSTGLVVGAHQRGRIRSARHEGGSRDRRRKASRYGVQHVLDPLGGPDLRTEGRWKTNTEHNPLPTIAETLSGFIIIIIVVVLVSSDVVFVKENDGMIIPKVAGGPARPTSDR